MWLLKFLPTFISPMLTCMILRRWIKSLMSPMLITSLTEVTSTLTDCTKSTLSLTLTSLSVREVDFGMKSLTERRLLKTMTESLATRSLNLPAISPETNTGETSQNRVLCQGTQTYVYIHHQRALYQRKRYCNAL